MKEIGKREWIVAIRRARTNVERHVFPGDRDQIRRLTVLTALAMVSALVEI